MKEFKLLLLVLAAFCACFEASPAAAENVLRWASAGGAQTFDPHAYDEPQTSAQYRQVYEALIGFDSNLELVPQLATTWRLVGPTTWSSGCARTSGSTTARRSQPGTSCSASRGRRPSFR